MYSLFVYICVFLSAVRNFWCYNALYKYVFTIIIIIIIIIIRNKLYSSTNLPTHPYTRAHWDPVLVYIYSWPFWELYSWFVLALSKSCNRYYYPYPYMPSPYLWSRARPHDLDTNSDTTRLWGFWERAAAIYLFWFCTYVRFKQIVFNIIDITEKVLIVLRNWFIESNPHQCFIRFLCIKISTIQLCGKKKNFVYSVKLSALSMESK